MAKKKHKKAGELQKAEPVRTLTPFEEMDRWWESFMPHGWLRHFRSEWPFPGQWERPFETPMPKVDVIDHDEEVVVRAELPGVEKDAIDVSLSETSVTIKAETRREEKEEKGDYYRCEIARGAFARTVTLPDYVDAENARASFKDGILELSLPKVTKAKRRTLEIE
jgi:HSP20 family protein